MDFMDAIVPRVWATNLSVSYEPCKNRGRSVVQVYLHERLCLYFYLATARQRDEAKRNRVECMASNRDSLQANACEAVFI